MSSRQPSREAARCHIGRFCDVSDLPEALRVRMHVRTYPPWEEPGPAIVETVARPEMTVSDVLQAGCGFGYAAFMPATAVEALAIEGGDRRLLQSAVNLFGVTNEGRITTGWSGSEVTWADFYRACAVGLISGDPSELVVFADQGSAGGGGVELFELAQWLFDNRDVIVFGQSLAMIGVGLEEAVRRPLVWLPKARRRALARQFARHGLLSHPLLHIVHRRARWDPDELAGYLGLTPPWARALLGEIGFEEGADGLYERSDDLELRVRRAAFIANASISPDVLDPAEVETLTVELNGDDWDDEGDYS